MTSQIPTSLPRDRVALRRIHTGSRELHTDLTTEVWRLLAVLFLLLVTGSLVVSPTRSYTGRVPHKLTSTQFLPITSTSPILLLPFLPPSPLPVERLNRCFVPIFTTLAHIVITAWR